MKKVISLLFILTMTILISGCKSKTITHESFVPMNHLGNITFTQDDTKSVSVEYPADGNEVTVSVTDDRGFLWTLTIPGNALLNPQTITLTPMQNITKDTLKTTPTSGIIMEPDGLEFLLPARLSVRGNNIQGLILSGNHQGSELKFTPVSNDENTLVSSIMHFSSAVFQPNDDPQIKQLLNEAYKQYKSAAEEARKLLKYPIVISEPPSIPLECLCDDQYNIASEYASTLVQPENSIISQVLSAGKSVQLLGGDTGGEDFDLVEKLLDRNMKKVHELIKTYKADDEKFLAVYYAAMHISREASLFNSDSLSDISAIGSWAVKVRDNSIEKLKNEHKYKLAGTILQLDKIAYIWDMGDFNTTIEKVINALTFKVSFDGYVDSSDEDGTTTWFTKGDATIKKVEITTQDHLEGDGEGLHTNYTTTDDEVVKILLTKDFSFKAGLYDVNYCEEFAYLGIDRFGAKSLTYQSDEGDRITFPSFFDYLSLYLKKYYSEKYDMYMVPILLQNGQSEFQESMEGTTEDGQISYTISIEHTPE